MAMPPYDRPGLYPPGSGGPGRPWGTGQGAGTRLPTHSDVAALQLLESRMGKPITLAYGRHMVAGTPAFQHKQADGSTVLFVALGDGEWDGAEVAWVNGKVINIADTSLYHFHPGIDGEVGTESNPAVRNQKICSFFPAGFTQTTFSRTCYSAFKLAPDPTAPGPEFDVRGIFKTRRVRIFDAAGNQTGYAYSANPAWELLDAYIALYLKPRALVNAPLTTAEKARIDFAMFKTSADDCDVDIGGGVKRFEGHVAFIEKTNLATIFDTLNTVCRGYIMEVGGKLGLYVDKPRASIFTITTDMIRDSSFEIPAKDLRQITNQITLKIRDTESGGADHSKDFAPFTAIHNEEAHQDQVGRVIPKDMDLGANTKERSERLVLYWMKRSLLKEQAHLLVTMDGGHLLPGDVVIAPKDHNFTSTRDWEVIEVTDEPIADSSGRVPGNAFLRELFLQQYDPSIFGDAAGAQQGVEGTSIPAGTAPAAAPLEPPNPPTWVAFTGEKGIFHFEIAVGAGALATLEHQVEIASDSGFTLSVLDLGLGSALTKTLRLPRVTRYARARSRYASSPWTAWVNWGAPTAVASGHPVDEAVGGSFDPASPFIDQMPDSPTYIRPPDLGATAVENGNFEASGTILPPPGWKLFLGAPTLSYETTTQYSGTRSLKIVATGQSGVATLRRWLSRGAPAGDKIYISCQAKVDSGTAVLRVSFRDAAGGLLGSGFASTTSTSWVTLTASGVAPTNTVYAQVEIYSNAAGTVYFDEVFARKVVDMDAEMADGTIYARTTPNQRDGGGRGYNALDTLYKLTTGTPNKTSSEIETGVGRASSAIDAGNVVVAAGLDFSRAYTAKHLDNVPDGTTYARTTPNQRDGGWRGYNALDLVYKLTTGTPYKTTSEIETGVGRASAAIDGSNILNAAALDWQRGYTNKPQDLHNLILGPTGDSGSQTSWGSGVTVVAVSGRDWIYALKFIARDSSEDNNWFPVRAGDKYFVAGWLSGLNANYPVALGLHFQDSAGGGNEWIPGGSVGAGVDWTYVTGWITVPAGKIRARPWLQIDGSSNFGYGLATRLFVGRYEIGAEITTGKSVDILIDGTTYARPLATRISSGKPLIDFSEAIHFNKNLDNVANTTTRKAVAEVDAANRALIDFSQAGHTAKHLDNVPDGSTRMGPTITRMNAATDTSGNLKLKNIAKATPTTSSPTTTSDSYVDMPEMSVTVTTQGNKILIIFSASCSQNTANAGGRFQLLRGTTILLTDYGFITPVATSVFGVSFNWSDAPAAGTYTYKIQWARGNAAGTLGSNSLYRNLQVTELG